VIGQRAGRYPDRVKAPEEIEVKIAAESAAILRARLRENGFRIARPRVFERNIALDDETRSLRKRNLLLRIRIAGKLITCTWKGKETAGGAHKRREEREFHADNLEECLAVFRGLGYAPAFEYEKYRTEYARQGEPGHALLDETPIGVFMELEGPARWIDRTAKQLGFSRDDYILLSYGRLYEQWRQAHGIESTDMSFGSIPTPRTR
jgi:adenylate cyclase class 2